MKMNPETTAAWKECLIHWNKLASGDQDEPMGEESCAFCQRFSSVRCTTPDGVEHCPIYRATGYSSCSATPYVEATAEHLEEIASTTHREAMRDFIAGLDEADATFDPEFSGECM